MVRFFAGVMLSGLLATSARAQIASSPATIEPLDIGMPVPSVWLTTARDQTVDLSEAVQGMPTVLIFYRGGWCPYCSKHLAGLQSIHDTLRELGYQIIAISPDPPEKLRETLQKSALGYTLLSDQEFLASQAFGLAFKLDAATVEKYQSYGIPLYSPTDTTDKVLPVPAVYLVSPEGVITFAHTNPDYTDRLDTTAILKAAEALSTAP